MTHFFPRQPSKFFKFFLLICLIILSWYISRIFHVDIFVLRKFILQQSLWLSGIIFIVLYVVSTTFIWFGPKDLFRILGGMIFGAFFSTVLVFICELINAGIMFHLSRYLGREYVQEKFHLRPGDLGRVERNRSVTGVLALRANILIPLRFLDLGYGLTAISFWKYAAVSCLALPPRIYLQQFIIAGVGEAVITDISVVASFMLRHPWFMGYFLFYCVAVVVLTIAAAAQFHKTVKCRQANN